jgi:hypothetical protein
MDDRYQKPPPAGQEKGLALRKSYLSLLSKREFPPKTTPDFKLPGACRMAWNELDAERIAALKRVAELETIIDDLMVLYQGRWE